MKCSTCGKFILFNESRDYLFMKVCDRCFHKLITQRIQQEKKQGEQN